MIRMPTNDEIIEKYLHNNFGRTASEQALNEARADERRKTLDENWEASRSKVKQNIIREERQRIKKMIEDWKDKENTAWAEQHFDSYETAEAVRKIISIFFKELLTQIDELK